MGGGRYSRDEAGEEVPDAFLLPHAALGRRGCRATGVVVVVVSTVINNSSVHQVHVQL